MCDKREIKLKMNECMIKMGALYRHSCGCHVTSRRGHCIHHELDSHVHMCTQENYVVLIDHVAYQCSIEKKLLIAIIKEKCVCLCRYILLVCSGNKDGLK